jgi:hypothetical protein
MLHFKAFSAVKPTGAAPAVQPIPWSPGGSWPTSLPVDAALLWSTAVTLADTFQTTSDLFAGIAAAGSIQRVLWAGAMHSGAFSFGHVKSGNSGAGVLVTGDTQYPFNPNNLSTAAIAFGTDQIELTWNPNHAAARIIHGIAFGGLLAAKVVGWTVSTDGIRTVNGVGFCPDFMVHLATISSGNPGASNGVNLGLGVMNAAGEQWAASVGAKEPSTNQRTDTARIQSPSRCLLVLRGHESEPEVLRLAAAFETVHADGFAVDVLTRNGLTDVWTLCLKGVGSQVGGVQKASGPTQLLGGLALPPKGLLLASVQEVASAVAVPHDRLGLGASDGVTHAASAHVNQDDHKSPFSGAFDFFSIGNCWRIGRDDRCFLKVNNSGIGANDTVPQEAPTIDAAATATFGASSIELGWSPNDAAETELLYAAFTDPGPGACDTHLATGGLVLGGTAEVTFTQPGPPVVVHSDGVPEVVDMFFPKHRAKRLYPARVCPPERR